MIDTSDSMGNEIEAVKDEVEQIVEAAENGGIVPSQYVLGE